MKELNKLSMYFVIVALCGNSLMATAQDNAKGSLVATLGFSVLNNTLPTVTLKVKTKVNGRFQPAAEVPFKIYLGEDAGGALVANVITNEAGQAEAYIPATLKNKWGADEKHTFYAEFLGNAKYRPSSADLTVTKARILLDTAEDKKVIVTVQQLKENEWVAAKDIEVKIGIKRLNADLNISEKQAYTTDSTGTVMAEYLKDSMPGDAKGGIILAARVEDNDQLGSLRIEKAVPWGKRFNHVNTFGRRTLFATRGRSPVWLLIMAYSIMFSVWGILSFLVYNLFTIKKLGKQSLSKQ